MPLLRWPACPLSRTRLEANRPTRGRLSFRVARKVRKRVAESAAQSGSGRSARPTSARVLMALVLWGEYLAPITSPEIAFSSVMAVTLSMLREWPLPG
jgi:hypothetical protein